MAAELRLGKLLFSAGWYSGEIPVLLELSLLVVWPDSGLTIFSLKIVQLCFGLHWDLGSLEL